NIGVGFMKNIKLIRVINDYTQLKVQMETGISQSMLSKYESGDLLPTTENLMILANFYNTSLDFLMDLTDQKEKYPAKNK
ncbi:MAG: helix-turn-helix domain-containing protein, partial [Eubacterium sp.]|nr:helix-turn-helix domain-containing protein [Eubacterium sp.]